ncbi:sphingolipid C4-monooxygenase [Ranunculus cassubicifolius]
MTSDETFGILIPIISYWLYGYLLESLGELFPTYRIRNKEEDRQQNKLVSRKHVIIGVLVQQGFQALVACTLYHLTNKKDNKDESGLLMVAISAFQIIIAMIVMDVWQYLLHRIMHQSHYLYKHIHSYHHRVVAPSAGGPFGRYVRWSGQLLNLWHVSKNFDCFLHIRDG